jgi:hypothetical protein
MEALEYQKLKRAAQDRYDADIAAIDRVWMLSHPNERFPGSEPSAASIASTSDARVTSKASTPKRTYADSASITAAMEKAFARVSGVFSWHEVRLLANGDGVGLKKGTLSQFLRRKASAGVVKVVVEGAGRRATTYRKVMEDPKNPFDCIV